MARRLSITVAILLLAVLGWLVWKTAGPKEPTPMVTNEVTAETLDIVYRGERKTLIRPGKPIPFVMQFWDSEPRTPFSLHRAQQTNEPAQFLGEFEVVGVTPPPENANVSLLFVLAGQQFILCARDNHNNQFLEIRRRK